MEKPRPEPAEVGLGPTMLPVLGLAVTLFGMGKELRCS